jgi:hypothetical protein
VERAERTGWSVVCWEKKRRLLPLATNMFTYHPDYGQSGEGIERGKTEARPIPSQHRLDQTSPRSSEAQRRAITNQGHAYVDAVLGLADSAHRHDKGE